jgi:N-methylhydantoinase A
MLGALRLMTVERGIDPRNFALMPFGGAGPLHAAALARSLGISQVLCPRASGVLSALGLAAAAPRRDVSRTVLIDDLGDTAPGGGLAKDAHARAHARARVSVERDTLIEEATRALGGPPTRIAVRHELRYQGQSFELAVEETIRTPLHPADSPVDPDALLEAFARAPEERYGYREDSTAVELVTIRVSAVGESPQLRPLADAEAPPIPGTTEIVFEGDPLDPPEALEAVVLEGALPPGTRMRGPALCALGESTLLVPPGWSGEVDRHGTVHLTQAG